LPEFGAISMRGGKKVLEDNGDSGAGREAPPFFSARSIPLSGLIAATPSFLISWAFLITWFDPFLFTDGFIDYLDSLILLEFFAILSAWFMGFAVLAAPTRALEILAIVGLGAVFTATFVSEYVSEFGEMWFAGAFVMLVANRVSATLYRPSGHKGILFISALLTMITLMISFFIAAVIPWPELGLNAQAVAQLKPNHLFATTPDRAGASPQALMALGAIYFAAAGLVTLYVTHIMERSPEPRA